MLTENTCVFFQPEAAELAGVTPDAIIKALCRNFSARRLDWAYLRIHRRGGAAGSVARRESTEAPLGVEWRHAATGEAAPRNKVTQLIFSRHTPCLFSIVSIPYECGGGRENPTHRPHQPAQPTHNRRENNMSKLTAKTRETLANIANLGKWGSSLILGLLPRCPFFGRDSFRR